MAFMAAAAPWMAGGAGVLSAMSAVHGGEMAKTAGDYNATIAAQDAQIAIAQAGQDANQVARETYLRQGAITARAGASGGKASGSVLDILSDSARQGEMKRQSVINAGNLAARGYTNTANLARMTGQNALTSSYVQAGSDLLAGGAQAYKLSRT